MQTVYLGLGCNLGDCVSRLEDLAPCLATILSGFRMSSLYRSEPQDRVDQPEFVNAVACGTYRGPPRSLLRKLLGLEQEFGRNRSRESAKGPRLIDIDILLCGNSIIETPELTIPHPAMHMRAFVLVPLLELAPELTDPRTDRPFRTSLEALPPQGVYYLRASSYTLG